MSKKKNRKKNQKKNRQQVTQVKKTERKPVEQVAQAKKTERKPTEELAQGWSVAEIEKNVEESIKRDQKSEQLEVIEIDEGPAEQRQKGRWAKWLVVILVLVMLGGVAVGVGVWRHHDSNTVTSGEDSGGEKEGESAEAASGEGDGVGEAEPDGDDGSADSDSAGGDGADSGDGTDGGDGAADAGAGKPSENTSGDGVGGATGQKPGAEPGQSLAPRPETPVDEPYAPAGSKLVALTFDDGPSAATTPRLLDTLRSKGVKVTFFVLGTMAQKAPDLLRREKAEGHEVASHTPYHNKLTYLTYAQVRAEAVEMDRIFKEILGEVPPFTRPPYGLYNATVGEALGQPMILWSVDPRDWADRNAAVVCERVLSATVDGSIVLIHDIHATTVEAVPCIIDGLKARGFAFLTVSELAAARNMPLINGQAYFKF